VSASSTLDEVGRGVPKLTFFGSSGFFGASAGFGAGSFGLSSLGLSSLGLSSLGLSSLGLSSLALSSLGLSSLGLSSFGLSSFLSAAGGAGLSAAYVGVSDGSTNNEQGGYRPCHPPRRPSAMPHASPPDTSASDGAHAMRTPDPSLRPPRRFYAT
jgi:hypothetical protein